MDASGWPGADNPVTLAVGLCLKTPGLGSQFVPRHLVVGTVGFYNSV